MIGTGTISGVDVLTIGSQPGPRLEAAFAPGAGMICCSLTHGGEQLLGQRNGLAGYVDKRSTMGIPLLYPWANRLAAARFELAGREVDVGLAAPPPKLDENGLPIHGLLSPAGGWSVDRHEDLGDGGAIAASYELREGDPLAAGFPFPHRLELMAELRGTALRITTTVRADAGSAVPVAFGFHPYLQLPGLPRERWEISAPVRERLVLDGRGIPTGERNACDPLDGALGDRTFDDAFAAPPGGRPFTLSGGGRRLAVRFDGGYPFTQLYVPPASDLLAWEPMTAPANALIAGGRDLRLLAPGEDFHATFAIEVSEL